MDPKHKDSLIRNRLLLVRGLIVSEELLSVLMIDNVITTSMKETIMAEPTSMGKAGRLLDLLPRRGPKAFEAFMWALIESGHIHLAEEMDPRIYREVKAKFNQETADEEVQFSPPKKSKLQESSHGGGQPQQPSSEPTPPSSESPMDVETSPTSHPAQETGTPTEHTPTVGGNDNSIGRSENAGLGISVRQGPQPASGSSPSDVETSSVTTTSSSSQEGEPMDIPRQGTQDVAEGGRGLSMARSLSADFDKLMSMIPSGLGKSLTPQDIEHLNTSHQVQDGHCLLIADDDESLRDNLAFDNIECLFERLGFKSFENLDVTLDTSKDSKNSELIKKEMVNLQQKLLSGSRCDGLLILVICRDIGDLAKGQKRLEFVNDCVGLFKSVECLSNKPKLFFFQFAVERDPNGSGIDEVDAGKTTVDDNCAIMILESFKWVENSFLWVLVQAFLKAQPAESVKTILHIIHMFCRERTVDRRSVALVSDLSQNFTLTAHKLIA